MKTYLIELNIILYQVQFEHWYGFFTYFEQIGFSIVMKLQKTLILLNLVFDAVFFILLYN